MKITTTRIFLKKLIPLLVITAGINTASAFTAIGHKSMRNFQEASNFTAAGLTALFDTTSSGFLYHFTDLSTDATTWYWDFGDGAWSTLQNPSHIYTSNGPKIVHLKVTDGMGAVDSISYLININASEFVTIPNVFSPNNDGINDQYYIENSGFTDYHFEIFDRWGIKVFDTTFENMKWDGRSTSGVDLSVGTYYYIFTATSALGSNLNSKGSITLVR